MLKNVIENYLTSIKEIQLFVPFECLLLKLGYFDIHLLHGPSEFGKDFIAKIKVLNQVKQYAFQLKVGDIHLKKFSSEIKPQLIEALTNNSSHPNFDKTLDYQVVFVTSGRIIPPTTISFQEFNDYVKNTLNRNPILIWERNNLTNDFLESGLESFFKLHSNPEFIKNFFSMYSRIHNDELLSVYEIYSYTQHWSNLDLNIPENKLQIFFETYFFSKMLMEKQFYYEACIFVSHLQRILMKKRIFDPYKKNTINYLLYIIKNFHDYHLDEVKHREKFLFHHPGILGIFYYPIRCIKSLELLALYLLLSPENNQTFEKSFYYLLPEKGSYRPISDNYGTSVLFISMYLIKEKKDSELKKYLNNITMWLCDRYEELGIASVGSSFQEEVEQLLSENLDGLTYHKRSTNFIATILLDICKCIGDDEIYSGISNELKAVSIILEYYAFEHENEQYDYEFTAILNDHNYSEELSDDYTHMKTFQKSHCLTALPFEECILLSFALRDRYFPQILLK